MAQITRGISKGQLVAFTFGQDAVAASQTNVQLPTVMSEASQVQNVGYTMPFDYEVVAVAADLSAAATAGTLTIGATIDGTEDADSTMSVTTQQEKYQRIARGKMRGVAGTQLGAEITSDGSWDGTTADLLVTVWAIVYVDGI